MATTAPIRLRRNGPGRVVMAITGASTGRSIPTTPIAIGLSSGDATAGRRVARLAKMDASTPIHPVPSGTYRLLAEAGGDLAKMDAWTVKITLISRDYDAQR